MKSTAKQNLQLPSECYSVTIRQILWARTNEQQEAVPCPTSESVGTQVLKGTHPNMHTCKHTEPHLCATDQVYYELQFFWGKTIKL